MTDGDAWRVGAVVDGRHKVLAVLGEGATGVVHRVRHLGWGLDLAVRSPRHDGRRLVAAAQAWAGLGAHPHVCACYYVRASDVPRVFAEYVDGGSLREWIGDGRLHRGGAGTAVARILDIAVQLAWGLGHAHRHGVVHHDVRPANVLLTPEGTAKLTDFGLAQACGSVPPGYASPEQSAGRPPGAPSDVYSFAVTVLEMFTGGATRTAAAGPVPPVVTGLLNECLAADPADRPADLDAVAVRLREVYAALTGHAHPRPVPQVVPNRADELNNRALFLLDLDRQVDAQAALEEALTVDPDHPEATVNLCRLLWRAGEVTDEELVTELTELITRTGRGARLLGEVHLERGDRDAAEPLLRGEPPGDGTVPIRAPEPTIFRTVEETVTSVGVSDDGRLVAVGLASGRAMKWILPDGDSAYAIPVPLPTEEFRRTEVGIAGTGFACAMSYRQQPVDGYMGLLGGPYDGAVYMFSFTTAAWVRLMDQRAVYALAYSKDLHRQFISVDRTVEVWSLQREGSPLRVLVGPAQPVTALGASTDGSVLVGGTADGAVIRWDTTRDAPGQRLDGGHISSVTAIVLTADDRFAVSVGTDATARVWDLDAGACVRVLTGARGPLTAVDVDPTGRWAATVGADGAVRLWELATGRCLWTRRPGSRVVRFAADGRSVLAGRDLGLQAHPVPDGPGAPLAFCRPLAG